MALILFVCITAPARLAFTDTDNLEWIIVDAIVDGLFFVDLVLNFFMAYHDEEFTLIEDRKVGIVLLKNNVENSTSLHQVLVHNRPNIDHPNPTCFWWR